MKNGSQTPCRRENFLGMVLVVLKHLKCIFGWAIKLAGTNISLSHRLMWISSQGVPKNFSSSPTDNHSDQYAARLCRVVTWKRSTTLRVLVTFSNKGNQKTNTICLGSNRLQTLNSRKPSESYHFSTEIKGEKRTQIQLSSKVYNTQAKFSFKHSAHDFDQSDLMSLKMHLLIKRDPGSIF